MSTRRDARTRWRPRRPRKTVPVVLAVRLVICSGNGVVELRSASSTYTRLQWSDKSLALRPKSPALLLHAIDLPFDVHQCADCDQ